MTIEWQDNDNRMSIEWQQIDKIMITYWQDIDNKILRFFFALLEFYQGILCKDPTNLNL